MRPRAALLALLVVCSLLAPAAGGATAPADASATVPPQQTALPQQAEPTSPETTVRVDLRADGSARWNVTMRFAVRNETAFENVSTAFENGSDVGPSVSTFEALAARGSDESGREMRVSGVERRGWRPNNDTGALTLAFTWSNFAAVSDDRIVVGDAFSGAWDISAEQRLVVYPPEDYLPQGFQPGTDSGVSNGVLRWDGPRTFDDNEPRIEYTSAGTGPTGTTPGVGPEGIDPVSLAGLALLAVVVAGAGYLFYARSEEREPADETEAEPARQPAETEASEPAADEPEEDDDADAGDEPEPAVDAPEDAGTDAAETEPDESLLSDEERVERMLERNGGRMKQANIVTETGWSNAKVSQLLSAMAEEGRVEKLRIGRENLISLPEEDDAE